jgi:hypothetical protein
MTFYNEGLNAFQAWSITLSMNAGKLPSPVRGRDS